MRLVIGVFVFLLLCSASLADERITRKDVELDSVQCGEYGRLYRGGWNECVVRITTKDDLLGVSLSIKILETGYARTTPPRDIRRREFNRQTGQKNDFDIVATRLIPFMIPANHPVGDFLLEARLSSGTIRRVKIAQRDLRLGKAVYRPITVV